MQDEQLLPIDIHSNKLLDWLISRRLCTYEWQKVTRLIREKINTAIQDMPPVEEITKLLSGTYINYFHCVRIVELLKDTESGKKDIFGRYSSQRMKDWQEILKLYEKDNAYLAEAAQMLIRNVNYEVPSIKKQIAKCQQVQEECERKEADYLKNSNEYKEKYNMDCKQFGIDGINIKAELLSLVSTLPLTYERIAKTSKGLDNAYQYYGSFKEFTLGRKEEPLCRLLSHLMKYGNTTVYEWRTGKKPERIEEEKIQYNLETDNLAIGGEGCDTINFGDDVSIDFGIGDSSGTNEIDFGDLEANNYVEVTAEGINHSDQNGNKIDWEIVVETNGETADVIDNVARGENALSILDNSSTRNDIIDELSELKSFLMQRIQEMQSDSDVLSSNRFQAAPLILQLQTLDSTQTMLNNVNELLLSLTNSNVQNLQLIRSSPRFVDRVADSLKQKMSISKKMLKSRELVAERRQQILQEQKELEPKLGLIISRTKELQLQIEGEISKRYKNRPVNIMGGVNAL
uniref:CDK5 regulatory subunit-associated protein 3 n=1 Tax=Hemiscolopendra marginata TaxID=943146 RepID=A0A646QCP7_9MYRI